MHDCRTTIYANSVFEQPWWLDTVAPGMWREIVLKNNNDEVIARWPFVIKRKWYGNEVIMPKLTQTLGPWIRDYAVERGNKHLSIKKDIYFKMLEEFPHNIRFDMTLDSKNSYILPFRWKGYSFKPTFSYRMEDLSDLNKIYSNFKKSTQGELKTAIKRVDVVESNDIDTFYTMYGDTFEAQGRKPNLSKAFVDRIITSAFENESGKLLISYDKQNREAHSGAFFLYDENICYYLMGANSNKYRNSGAQSLVIWEGIQFGATVSKAFDFEGSMVEGIETFFRKFGGKQIINYNVTKSTIFFEMAEIFKPKIKRMIGFKI